jgi:hypothetical protein
VSFPHQLSLAAEGAFRLPDSAIRSFVKKEEGEYFFRRKNEKPIQLTSIWSGDHSVQFRV